LGHVPRDAQSASDLKGFGSRAWLSGLLDPAQIVSTNYFGGSKMRDGKMSKFVRKDVPAFSAEQRQQLKSVLIAVSAEAGLQAQREHDQREAQIIAEGKTLLGSADLRCAECHAFHKKDEDATGPDLTGYGSREWLTSFIYDPKHERFYGKRNDRMPAFGREQMLDTQAIGLIADWLRGEWYVAPYSKPLRD
jgi:ubiquinol-cytochrome c reductase cytochrome b subunit